MALITREAETVPGPATGTASTTAEHCPVCAARRIGSFRFCLGCRHDFDLGIPRGLSVASSGPPAESLVASPWSLTPSVQAPSVAAAGAGADLVTLAPVPIAEPHPIDVAMPLAAPRGIPRRISRRLSVALTAIVIALFGVAGALVAAVGRPNVAGPPSAAAHASSPSATTSRSEEPIPTYATALRPGPITFGTRLSGVTVTDPTPRIKIGKQVIWVAHLSQPMIEPDVEISIAAIVSGDQVVFHRERMTIGLNGILTANPGVNSRDLGVGDYVVRYTSLGTVLAEGTFTVVK